MARAVLKPKFGFKLTEIRNGIPIFPYVKDLVIGSCVSTYVCIVSVVLPPLPKFIGR